jgi:release factor glutamine methyltransferase
MPIFVLPEVMNPKLFRTGEFLAQSLNSDLIPDGSKVLDMGTGSGIAALVSAKWAARVVAVDINPAAVRCARINVLLNQLENKIEVRQGDLFAPLKNEKFDVVLFNPPYFKGQPANVFEMAMFGESLIESFASKLQEHLLPDGKAFLLLSNLADLVKINSYFKENGFELETMAKRWFFNETLLFYRVTSKTTIASLTKVMDE